MVQKIKDRIMVTWNEENEAMLQDVARKHEAAMAYNGIHAYTKTTGEKQPNASGIYRYLLLSATGNIKRIR